MEMVCLGIFSCLLLGNSKSCETEREKKWKFSSKGLSLKRLTDNMENDEAYKHLPSEFYYPEERLDENSDETSVKASRLSESQEEIEGFFKEQKSANTECFTSKTLVINCSTCFCITRSILPQPQANIP